MKKGHIVFSAFQIVELPGKLDYRWFIVKGGKTTVYMLPNFMLRFSYLQ